MIFVNKIVLDVLKPHQPNILDFSKAIAAIGAGYIVKITVIEMDESTETLKLVVEGDAIDFDAVQAAIKEMGASLHSIDEVEVRSDAGIG